MANLLFLTLIGKIGMVENDKIKVLFEMERGCLASLGNLFFIIQKR